jgi:hypothetical protein
MILRISGPLSKIVTAYRTAFANILYPVNRILRIHAAIPTKSSDHGRVKFFIGLSHRQRFSATIAALYDFFDCSSLSFG